MAKTVAIICEYNPFHMGHKHQIDEIRKNIPDARVVAIMSGNVTQRGEFAIFDKYTRAKSAVLCGVNAVYEIPYPYSCASAEIFARAGVKIASELGADYLCFGSESANLENLWNVANLINSVQFEEQMSDILKDKTLSYSVAREEALKRLGVDAPKFSNDILGVEYLRAISQIAPSISPYPIKRIGEGYKSESIGELMSASAIRKSFYEGKGLLSIPSEEKEFLDGENYLDLERANDFLFRSTLMMKPSEIEGLYDVPSGCGYFVSEIAKSSNGANEFFASLSSKSYTSARLRRIVMYACTGVKTLEPLPTYTQLLATDSLGREHLKALKKTIEISVLTKHSDSKKLSEAALENYTLGKKTDELYYTLLKRPLSASEAYKKTTIIM